MSREQRGGGTLRDHSVSRQSGSTTEWIVACATSARTSVVIVSRDGDYGYGEGEKMKINDWLREEFRERVGTRSS